MLQAIQVGTFVRPIASHGIKIVKVSLNKVSHSRYDSKVNWIIDLMRDTNDGDNSQIAILNKLLYK
jgi:hypothetical protein